jgi:LacI family transcriptional regulator
MLGMRYDYVSFTSEERIRGYRHAGGGANLPPRIDTSGTDYDSTEKILKSYLSAADAPDAIFAVRNQITIYAVKAFRKLRIKVPAMVALLGFDDFELAATLEPSVSVVRQQDNLMGKIASEILFEKIMKNRRGRNKFGRSNGRPMLCRLNTELVPRESCGCIMAKPHRKETR